MADGDESTSTSGGPRKLLLPVAPGPAQPLTHLAVRFRKKLDASLSSQGYYDVAQGRESSRVAQIKVLDLALHPGLSPTDLVSLSPDRRYRYEIERSKLELQVEQAMQKKYDVTMDERTVLCEAIAISNDTNNPVLAKRIRDDCNYTATLGIAGGYYDGPRAYNLQIQFLISPGGRSEWDKNFYELAWKAHKEQGPLPNNCSVSDFETPVDAFIELIQPYRAAALPAMEAMEHIINMMPPMYVTEKWMLKTEAVTAGWYVDMATVRAKCVFHIKRDQKQQKAEPLLIAAPEYLTAVASTEELAHFSEVIGYSFDVGRAHSSMTLRSSKPLGSRPMPARRRCRLHRPRPSAPRAASRSRRAA